MKKYDFTKEENLTILEIARVALADADIFDYIADKMDIADSELKNLQEKVNKATNNP